MDDHTCVCQLHGEQPIAFVCKHIVAVPRGETVGFVSYRPDNKSDLRDAWCEACDVHLRAYGGDWMDDTVEVPGGIALICAECYRARQRDAVEAGRRVFYEG